MLSGFSQSPPSRRDNLADGHVASTPLLRLLSQCWLLTLSLYAFKTAAGPESQPNSVQRQIPIGVHIGCIVRIVQKQAIAGDSGSSSKIAKYQTSILIVSDLAEASGCVSEDGLWTNPGVIKV